MERKCLQGWAVNTPQGTISREAMHILAIAASVKYTITVVIKQDNHRCMVYQ